MIPRRGRARGDEGRAATKWWSVGACALSAGYALAYLPTLSAFAIVPPMIISCVSFGRSSTTSL